MTLIDVLGRNFIEPEVAKLLGEFPGLRPEPSETADGVSYLRSLRDGLLVKLSEAGEILAIFLMSEGKDGASEFRGELPGRLNFAAEPEDAIRALGAPALRKPPATLGGIRLGELLRFDRPAHSVSIQFRPDHDGIDLVTLMAAAQVPGRSVAAR